MEIIIDKNAENDYKASKTISENKPVKHWARGNCYPDNREDVNYFIEIMENYLIQDSLKFKCLLSHKIEKVKKVVDNLYLLESYLKGSL
tara:strand:- start:1018 stop:1284 length:267 start_codon:yes stop_codon:yes gene_type:complete